MHQLVTVRRQPCWCGDRIAHSIPDDRRDGLMGRTIGLPTKGEGYDEARRRAPDSHGAASRGAGDRVGDFGFDAVVPGDWDGGRRRRRRTLSRRRICMASRGGQGPPLLALLVGILAFVVVLGNAMAQTGAAPEGSVYRRPLGHDPITLDPARISDVYSRSVAHQIFDGLAQFDQTLTVTPALAEFWRATRDGLVWTFTLRKGVKFHHGRELTSDDVVYSLTRLVDPRIKSPAGDLFSAVKGVDEYRSGKATQVSGFTVIDRYQVQVTLHHAPAPFVSFVAVGAAKILPRDVAESQGEAFGQRPLGTGPFRFVG